MPKEESGEVRVAAVFPFHNRRELTVQCVRSLLKADTPGIDLNIVVVDDGSTDGTSEELARDFPQVKVVRGDGNLWFTEGTNVAAREAMRSDPDYVLMMNDDQVFDSRFLEHMVETARKHAPAVVGSLLLLWDTPHRLFQVSPVWSVLGGGWRHWYEQTVWTIPDKPWEVDIIVGNCLLVPSEAIRQEGLMDSARFPNFGDAEYTPRLKKAGWKLLIDPRARVFCQPNTPPATISKASVGERIRMLLVDLGHPHNLRRRLYEYVLGAPDRISGLAGYFVFLFRVALGMTTGRSTGLQEPPLSETFADRVIDS